MASINCSTSGGLGNTRLLPIGLAAVAVLLLLLVLLMVLILLPVVSLLMVLLLMVLLLVVLVVALVLVIREAGTKAVLMACNAADRRSDRVQIGLGYE